MSSDKEKILIVDDEGAIREILEEKLSAEGYCCDMAVSGDAAWQKLHDGNFALALVDIRLPDMNGIELTRKVKTACPDVGVIVISGVTDIEIAIQAMRLGAEDYLTKPFNLDEIGLSVERVLLRRRLIIAHRNFDEVLKQRVKEATRDLEKANQELLKTKEYLENLLHSSPDAIVTTDLKGIPTYLNESATSMLGYTLAELDTEQMTKLFVGARLEARRLERQLMEYDKVRNFETELVRKDGTTISMNLSASLLHDEKGDKTGVLIVGKDITERKQMETELRELSIRDSLTGLYNQRHFYDRLQREIERSVRQKHSLSLTLFDIDGFKGYNDAHGHLEGDTVLQIVGRITAECIRENVDAAFRYGGDEFTVILSETNLQQALLISDRIRKSFEARQLDGLTLSIGVVEHDKRYAIESFIRYADEAMYEAKRAGGNQIVVYPPPRRTKSSRSTSSQKAE